LFVLLFVQHRHSCTFMTQKNFPCRSTLNPAGGVRSKGSWRDNGQDVDGWGNTRPVWLRYAEVVGIVAAAVAVPMVFMAVLFGGRGPGVLATLLWSGAGIFVANRIAVSIIGKTLEGSVSSWNPGAKKLFGNTAAETIGQMMLIPTEHAGEESQMLARITQGESVQHVETTEENIPRAIKICDFQQIQGDQQIFHFCSSAGLPESAGDKSGFHKTLRRGAYRALSRLASSRIWSSRFHHAFGQAAFYRRTSPRYYLTSASREFACSCGPIHQWVG